MTGYSFSTPAVATGTWNVNGPEDATPDRDAIDWRAHEGRVRRLRRRIFKATQEQDWAQVRSLQKMMLRSWSNTLLSVRQATQRNAGRTTAGVDEEIGADSRPQDGGGGARARLHLLLATPAGQTGVHTKGQRQAAPTRHSRIMDRCHEGRVKHIGTRWEACSNPSHTVSGRVGARGRDRDPVQHDERQEREAVVGAGRGPGRGFDRIDHDHLLHARLVSRQDLIRAWPKAGVSERQGIRPTEEETPRAGRSVLCY